MLGDTRAPSLVVDAIVVDVKSCFLVDLFQILLQSNNLTHIQLVLDRIVRFLDSFNHAMYFQKVPLAIGHSLLTTFIEGVFDWLAVGLQNVRV